MKLLQSLALMMIGWCLVTTGTGAMFLGTMAGNENKAYAMPTTTKDIEKGNPDDPYHNNECQDPIDGKKDTGCYWSNEKNRCRGDCNPSKEKCKSKDGKTATCKRVVVADGDGSPNDGQ